MATAPISPAGSGYPVQFDIQRPESLSRLLIFVKWLLILPHQIILYFLTIALYVVLLIAFFAILITAKYPEGLFTFAVGVRRWSANASAYSSLMRDEYPPFSLDAGRYPVGFDVAYPQNLNRFMPLIKWLLAIPHLIVLIFLTIGLAVTTVIAWFAILFTGSYPEGLFNFAVGVNRWGQRVGAYVMLMTDEYPPFSLDV